MATRTGGLSDLVRGALLPVEGAWQLLGDAPMLALAALPMALTAAATLATAFWAWAAGARLLEGVWPRPDPCHGCPAASWLFERLEDGGWHAAWFIAAALLTALAGLVASRVLAAPAMDALSARAMRSFEPRAGPGPGGPTTPPLPFALLGSLGRALGRTALLVAGALAIAALALFPGGAAVSTPLALAWGCLWLFVDTALYPLQWVGQGRLADVVGLVRARPALCAGFAASAGALMLLPLAGLVVTPAAVAGACLLVGRVRGGAAEAVVARTPAMD